MMCAPTILEVLPEGGDSRKQVDMIFVLAVLGCAVFTAYAAGVAAGRRRAAQDFYASLLSEARAAYGPGREALRAHLTGGGMQS